MVKLLNDRDLSELLGASQSDFEFLTIKYLDIGTTAKMIINFDLGFEEPSPKKSAYSNICFPKTKILEWEYQEQVYVRFTTRVYFPLISFTRALMRDADKFITDIEGKYLVWIEKGGSLENRKYQYKIVKFEKVIEHENT